MSSNQLSFCPFPTDKQHWVNELMLVAFTINQWNSAPCVILIKPSEDSSVKVNKIKIAKKNIWKNGQGILKGEVSLYHWPPVWLVWNKLYVNWHYFLFLFAKQTNPNQSNRRSMVQWYRYFSIPWKGQWCQTLKIKKLRACLVIV